jgi:hypothetical protein
VTGFKQLGNFLDPWVLGTGDEHGDMILQGTGG